MYGWIDPFYERAEPAVEPGQIWCAQPIALPPRHTLKLGKVDPKDDSKLSFTIAERSDDGAGHPPIHSLGLRSDELLVVAKARRNRLVIVLGMSTGPGLGSAGVTVVPLYEAAEHDADARRRVSRYEYANAFYLPAFGRPQLAESIARLDHAQPVGSGQLADPAGLRLSADALDALVEWFVACTTSRLPADSLIVEYRREMLAGGA